MRTDSAVAATEDHDPVNHPSHYTSHPSGIECLEITRLLGFDLGNCVKYVWRRGDKGNPAQDLDKSVFYLDDGERNAPETLYVPANAADLLYRAATREPDPVAADFYRAVADRRFSDAGDRLRVLRAALD